MSAGVRDIEDLEGGKLSFSAEELGEMRPSLLSWYTANRRLFPWRGDAGEGYKARPCTAYGTWVSEIMLQQTRTETVIPYWNRWMDKWPTVQDLAAASPEEVNSMWAGLGYYRRAQQLLQGARVVANELDAVVPQTAAELLSVPGIGPYTAGAISSIAYGQVEPVVDGNVIRVLSRLRALKEQMGTGLTKECWRLAHEIVDPIKPGDFNQSLMELGSTICKPLNPDCSSCPLSKMCVAKACQDRQSDRVVTAYPVKAEKKPPKKLFFNVHVFFRNCSSGLNPEEGLEFLLLKRPGQGLLANQWEFPTMSKIDDSAATLSPLISAVETMALLGFCVTGAENDEISAKVSGESKFPELTVVSSSSLAEPVTHLFSHQHHTMFVTIHRVGDNAESKLESTMQPARWMGEESMKEVGITTGVKKILKSVQQFCTGASPDSSCSKPQSVAKKRSISTIGTRVCKKSKVVDGTANTQRRIKSYFQKEQKEAK